MKNLKSNELNINLENYSGSLDVLLDLAKSQKVDLTKISITKLADQFVEFINAAREINLDLASEYLLMATWLTYLKSKLLLPDDEKDDFKVLEVAEKLKLQLKKLELIRLMSDLLLKKNRLGLDVFLRGKPDGIRSIHSPKYVVSLYEILKAYSNHRMRKDFLRVNIPRLPVLTTEEGIKRIKVFFGNLNDWKKISELVPKEFMTKNFIKTGLAGIFSAALELSKEGKINIMQKKLFDYVLIKERKT